MADLNSTIVRGNLRVTEDINTNGRITGGNITGHLALNENAFNVNFRPNLASYTTGFYYGTTGNEALTLTTKNAVTAIQFMNGQDPATLVGDSWRGLVPALQIKYNKVAINKALGENAEPSYNLDVNGSMGATIIYEDGTALINRYATKYETYYIPVLDTRASNITPYVSDNYPGKVTWHLKLNSTIGISDQGSYGGVLQLTPWNDSSGGPGHQLAFGTNGAINHRYGTTEWSNWKTLIDSENIGSQSVSYAASAGSATKATQDGNGNNIVNTYALKSHPHTPSDITGPSNGAQTEGPFLLANEGNSSTSKWVEKGNLLNGYATQTWVTNQGYSKLTLGTTSSTAAKGDHTHSNILTIAPTSANTSGEMRFVVLSSEPTTKYNGYLYIITG